MSARVPHRSRGITLVEVMVSMFVLGLVMTAALQLFLPSLERFSVADASYDAQRHALAAVRMLEADLRETRLQPFLAANNVVTATSSSPVTIAMPVALLVPTARTQTGEYRVSAVVSPGGGDAPDWQGWVAYWTTAEEAPNESLLRLYRGFVPGRIGIDPPPTALPSGRLLARGVSAVVVEVGQRPNPSPVMVAGLGLNVDPSTTLYSSGGRTRVSVNVSAARMLHDRANLFQGGTTIDVPL